MEEIAADTLLGSDLEQAIKQLPSFQRLKKKFIDSGRDFSEGLKPTDLTVGDLVDILDLYCETGKSGFSGFDNVYRIAKTTLNESPVPGSESSAAEISKIRAIGLQPEFKPDRLDREDALYTMPVDLAKIDENEFGTGVVELSHYPGGICISRDPLSDTGQFRVVLTNRQQQDNGKVIINKAFRSTGLPLMTNIQ